MVSIEVEVYRNKQFQDAIHLYGDCIRHVHDHVRKGPGNTAMSFLLSDLPGTKETAGRWEVSDRAISW